MNLESVACARCDDGFEPKAKIVNSNGELFHSSCFVCAQCFRPFPDGVFYEFDGRKYCEHDFHVLFAPCCSKCGEFIIGRVIKVGGLLLDYVTRVIKITWIKGMYTEVSGEKVM